MRGILVAGRAAAARASARRSISTPLMPIHDKPMIYYPLSTLMLAGVREALVVSAPQDALAMRRLLGDGSQWGMSLRHAVQPRPEGPAGAITVDAAFSTGHPLALVLGGTLFHGMEPWLTDRTPPTGAQVFAYRVMDPQAYGVVEFDAAGSVLSIEEKPARPRSDYAVPGLYFYDADVCQLAAELAPSPRGRLEITALNAEYLRQGRLTAQVLGRSVSWLDTGSIDAVRAATQFVQMVEARQGHKLGCVEEVAWRQQWIDDEALLALAARQATGYGQYLTRLVDHRRADTATVVSLPDQGRHRTIAPA